MDSSSDRDAQLSGAHTDAELDGWWNHDPCDCGARATSGFFFAHEPGAPGCLDPGETTVSVLEVHTKATPVHPRVCVARVPHPSGYAYAQRLLFALRGEGIAARLEFHEAVERSAEDWYYEDREAEEARLAKLPNISGCRAVTEAGECEGCNETATLYERVACTLGYAGHPGAEFTAFQVCATCLGR